jgi:hypothetical protein
MAEDLSPFFSDPLLTVPVVYLAANYLGIFDKNDFDIAGGLVQSRKFTLLMKASDFSADPVGGAAITVDSVAYTINSFHLVDDGKLVQMELSKT